MQMSTALYATAEDLGLAARTHRLRTTCNSSSREPVLSSGLGRRTARYGAHAQADRRRRHTMNE